MLFGCADGGKRSLMFYVGTEREGNLNGMPTWSTCLICKFGSFDALKRV